MVFTSALSGTVPLAPPCALEDEEPEALELEPLPEALDEPDEAALDPEDDLDSGCVSTAESWPRMRSINAVHSSGWSLLVRDWSCCQKGKNSDLETRPPLPGARASSKMTLGSSPMVLLMRSETVLARAVNERVSVAPPGPILP